MKEVVNVFNSRFGKKKTLDWKHGSFNMLAMTFTAQDDCSIVIDNAAYVKKILDKRWTEDIGKEFQKHRGTLNPSSIDLFNFAEQDGWKASSASISNFRTCVGELGFAVGVRIDIVKEVTFLQSLQANPGPKAWKVYRQVIAYLKESPTSPIRLGSDPGDCIVAYIDVGYANHTDSKSHTGMFITIGPNGGPIYVSSKKQKLVTNSTGESEVTGLAEGMKHCIFGSKIHQELGLSDKMKFKIMEDNESAIHMVNNGEGVGGKAKHFRVRYRDDQQRDS